MYLHRVFIEGYKNFTDKFEIEFSKGLNIIVGENATGKTGIINAIRMILKEDCNHT
ncbi:MAG: AAA family ATPase [Deferribacterales bacterium]